MKTPITDADSLEVKLVFKTIACRTCDFFWSSKRLYQPYGPYSTFDFEQNYPAEGLPVAGATSFAWTKGSSAKPGFPLPGIMDGCRKAPIMTIGINPNLTAYFPGPMGAFWSYPAFASANDTDEWIKYAWYYRYRTIYQEHFDLSLIEQFLLPDGQIVASADGRLISATVTGNVPAIDLKIRYNGDKKSTLTKLSWQPGRSPYVVLTNININRGNFKKGQVIAAKLSVPADNLVNINRQVIGYYQQFMPVLSYFNQFLQAKGYPGANARMGEDVCQLDMVACASPHWGPPFLGGTVKKENEVITNCVTSNAWVIKQLVQTRPAVLCIVGESSFNMFHDNFGSLVKSGKQIPSKPEDGAFTLLRMTIDAENPVTLQYSYTEGDTTYNLSTRVVISPHFSFNINFVPQFRFSPADMQILQSEYVDCFTYLTKNPGVNEVKPLKATDFTPFYLLSDVQQTLIYLSNNYPAAYEFVIQRYYDPHSMLSIVLEDEYNKGTIAWVSPQDTTPGYLARNEGACNFCVNSHWTFPLGCPYNKNTENQPPPGFLESVTADMILKGKPAIKMAMRSYAEKIPMTPDNKILI